jgi:hypothetical protein
VVIFSSFEAFRVPTGYRAVDLDKPLSSLKNKQIWMMQLPPKFDLKKVKKLPVAFASGSEPTFSVDGVSYWISQEESDSVKDRFRVLASTGDGYKVSSKRISRSYKISEQASIPDIDIKQVNIPKPVVPEKTGLYMRVQPTGYGPSSYEESTRPEIAKSQEMADKTTHQHEHQEETPRKKHKKEKHKDKEHKKDKRKSKRHDNEDDP